MIIEKDRIAVLMTCHNRKEKTIACLNALNSQVGNGFNFSLEVYLVDDNSIDGTSEEVSKRFESVKIIKGSGNLYWNRGMHLAWTEAKKGDYPFYLWLNDDTILQVGAIPELIKCARETLLNAIICGTTCSSDGKTITYGGRTKKTGLIVPNSMLQLCEYFNGNCVLIPRNVFRILGNLDYRFHHGIGDFDYGLRAKKLGLQSFISSNIIGICDKNEDVPMWRSSNVGLIDRIKAFKSPLAVDPFQFFVFEKRHFGIMQAIFHFITIHIRLVFPGVMK